MNIIMFAAVFVAYFVKGIAGFANTLVFSSIMNFFTTNINIVPMEAVLGTPANLLVAYRSRKDIEWKKAAALIAIITVGMVPGVLLLKTGDDRTLKIALGCVIIALGAEMLTRGKRRAVLKEWMAWVLAAATGVLMGTFGIGATMVVCVERLTKNYKSMRGTLCAVFLADNVIRMALYCAAGMYTSEMLLTVLKLVPFMLAGLMCGMKLAGRLPEKTVRTFIIVMLMLSGLSLALTALLS